MGKRSTTTTKSGKFMNPTDQARKEARRKELKKNKKTRMLVRASVLKNKNVEQILNDLRDLDTQEYDPERVDGSVVVEKVIKEKRRKLLETLERVLKLYARDDPERAEDVKEMISDYEKEKKQLIHHYDSIRQTRLVSLEEIPLPPMNFTDIPLPSDDIAPPPHLMRGIHLPISASQLFKGKHPPGPPPGRPPLKKFKQYSNLLSLNDGPPGSDDTPRNKKSVRFTDADIGQGPARVMALPGKIIPGQPMPEGSLSDIPLPPGPIPGGQPPGMMGMPPRFPPGSFPPGMMPHGMMMLGGHQNQLPGGSVVSAPPSIIQKTPQVTIRHQPTIQAKPQINPALKAASTRFVPTALKVKRDGTSHKVRTAGDIAAAAVAASENKKVKQKPVPTASKDEIYQQFMAEVSGLL